MVGVSLAAGLKIKGMELARKLLATSSEIEGFNLQLRSGSSDAASETRIPAHH